MSTPALDTPWLPLWPVTPTPFRGVSLRNDGTQPLTWSYQPLPFAQEDYDTNDFHSLTVNPSRITIPAGLGGMYLFSASWVNASGPSPGGVVRKNGTNIVFGMGVAFLFPAVPGDYFEVFTIVSQETAAVAAGSRFSAHYYGAMP